MTHSAQTVRAMASALLFLCCHGGVALDAMTFRCGPGFPCAPGFVCHYVSANEGTCKRDPQAAPDAQDDVLPRADTISSADIDTTVPTQDTAPAPDSPSQDTDILTTDTPPTEDTSPADDVPPPTTLCDPATDPICFSPCPGAWPYLGLPETDDYPSPPQAVFIDMSGDGIMEIVVHGHRGLVVLAPDGTERYTNINSDAFGVTHARGRFVAAQLMHSGNFSEVVKPLDIFAAPGKVPTLVGFQADPAGGPELITQAFTNQVAITYDNAAFLAHNVDATGTPEFFGNHGCDPLVQVFGQGLSLLGEIPSEDKSCTQHGGRLLTDLDGDGLPELLAGVGLASDQLPELWKGEIRVYRLNGGPPLNSELFCPTSECFPTAFPPLHRAGVTDMIRIGDRIFARVKYFQTNTAPATGEMDLVWEYFLTGEPVGQPLLIAMPTPTDIDRDGVPEHHPEMRYLGLWDVTGDSYPDRIYAEGATLRVARYKAADGTFEEIDTAALTLPADEIAVTSIWDADGDGRLNVLVTDNQGRVRCFELGDGTVNRAGSLPPHSPAYLRTNQWDNYEPNEGSDIDGDGIPDLVPTLPSTLTAHGAAWSYLTTQEDVDSFIVDANANAEICLHSPTSSTYTLQVFSFEDKTHNDGSKPTPDGAPDGLIYTDASAKTVKCFSANDVEPPRLGEHKLLIRVSAGDTPVQPYWPYWIETPAQPAEGPP